MLKESLPKEGLLEQPALMLKNELVLPGGKRTNLLMVEDTVVVEKGRIVNAKENQKATHKIIGAFYEPEQNRFNILALCRDPKQFGTVNVIHINAAGELTA